MGDRLTVFVSFVPRQGFVAHRDGLPAIRAPTLKELRSEVARLRPEAEIMLSLTRGARAEVARRTHTPTPGGWT